VIKILGLVLLFVSSLSSADTGSVDAGGSTPRSHTWGWVGQAGDMYFGPQSSYGIGAGVLYYLNDKSILSAELGVGTNLDFWSSINGDTVNGSNTRIGVYYKRFVTRTFYIKGGLEDRMIDYKVVHYPTFGGYPFSQDSSINLYTVWLGIGNHWQIRQHLIIGCDWVGVSIPFANSGFTETDSGPVLDPWNLKSYLADHVSVDVGRFYMGMDF
jgi:hypothetical protein